MIRTTPEQAPPARRFDSLFTDARHYRGDCRLMGTAVRRGWLNDATQADREALIARFTAASGGRSDHDTDTMTCRALGAQFCAALAMDRANQNAHLRAARYSWAGEPTDHTTGRPRERWHVTDYPSRIDANELRRRVLASGTDLRTLAAIDVRSAGVPDAPGERVTLSVLADARYGWRVWLVCPHCERRRTHLYPVRVGLRCRRCAGIGYENGPRTV